MSAYSSALKENKIYQSMSGKGNCYDNSVMENFFGILKQKMYYGTTYYSFNELKEAIEKYIIRKNAKQYDVDADWMQEIYAVLTDENMTGEYDGFKKTFYIDDQEEECIIQSYDEVQNLDRKLLLFEIAESIKENVFTPDEMSEILQVYEIKPEEIETIFLDLYSKYDYKILLGKDQPKMKRRNTINKIAKKWYYMTAEERKQVLADNKITTYEENMIAELSNNIVKYKKMLVNRDKDNLKSLTEN